MWMSSGSHINLSVTMMFIQLLHISSNKSNQPNPQLLCLCFDFITDSEQLTTVKKGTSHDLQNPRRMADCYIVLLLLSISNSTNEQRHDVCAQYLFVA
jgi:hypothetical protein